MYLSVVIPTRNRSAMLDSLLKSVKKQTFAPDRFEVIVVDNGSDYKTRVVAQFYKDQIENFNYVFESQPGLHRGRHAGLRVANGDILVFADDDIQALPTWLEGIAEAFESSDVMLAGGKCLPLFENQPPPWLMKLWKKPRAEGQILGYLSLLDLGDSTKDISPYHVFGCNFSIRKQTLVEAGGFHPDAMPPELVRFRGDGETYVSKYIFEKGYRTVYNPKASVYHWVSQERMTESYFCKRAYLQGISDSYSKIRVDGLKLHRYNFIRILIKRLPRIVRGKLEAKIIISYLNGYIYHLNEVHKDSKLGEWVTKNHYLG